MCHVFQRCVFNQTNKFHTKTWIGMVSSDFNKLQIFKAARWFAGSFLSSSQVSSKYSGITIHGERNTSVSNLLFYFLDTRPKMWVSEPVDQCDSNSQLVPILFTHESLKGDVGLCTQNVKSDEIKQTILRPACQPFRFLYLPTRRYKGETLRSWWHKINNENTNRKI